MIQEALHYLVGLGRPHIHKEGDLTYTQDTLEVIAPPAKPTVQVSTLQAIVDLVEEAQIDDIESREICAHIVSPTQVNIIDSKADEYGRRRVFVSATAPAEGRFQFGQFLDTERFIIGLNSGFQTVLIDGQDNDWTYVLKVASGIAHEESLSLADDGISQTAAMKQGIVLRSTEILKSRVNLAPWRTFAELDQPVSTFLLRAAKNNHDQLTLALFEADGGRWKIDAAKRIADWLSAKLTAGTVIR
jgi:hypothetical protein